jgi:monoamine oxidase
MGCTDLDVLVIGAGIAGLTAAFRIERDLPGARVRVLEANDYPGGRMKTTAFGGEAGGESIGFYYTGLHDLAHEVGVPIDSAPLTILNQSFNLGYYFEATGKCIQQRDWAAWPDNPLPAALRAVAPMMLMRELIARVPRPGWEGFTSDPRMREYAAMSLGAFLRAQGMTDAMVPFIESNFEVNDDLETVSAMTALLKTWITDPMAFSRYYFVRDGNQTLAREVAARLRDIRYRRQVVSVTRAAEGRHVVETREGERHEADCVVFAVPASIMTEIAISPALPALQQEALDRIRYTPSIKIFYRLHGEWENDGLPPFMWTDTDVNMLIPVYDAATRPNPLTGDRLWGVYTVSNGARARRLYELQDAGVDIADHCRAILERLRPSLKGHLVLEEIVDWGRNPTARGAFHYYEPSERILDYYEQIATPGHGRYFAGEHTEIRHKGFEAAVNSGLRAARELCRDAVNRRVLIVGCGKLGQVLARHWRARFHDVRVTTTTAARRATLAAIADDVRVLALDGTAAQRGALRDAMTDRDVVVVLTGPTPGTASTPAAIEEHYDRALVIPARDVVAAVTALPAGSRPRVMVASSLSVYGTGEQTASTEIDETVPVSPTNPSARKFAEMEAIYRGAGIAVDLLRFGALYDYDEASWVNQALIAQRMGGLSPFDGDAFLHAITLEDAARAIALLSERADAKVDVFNVCEQSVERVQPFFDRLCAEHELPPLTHTGVIKGARRRVSAARLRAARFQPTPRNVLFIGSGALSLNAAERLVASGSRVTLTTTSDDKAAALRAQLHGHAEMIVLEGRDRAAVAAAMRGRDAVVIGIAPIKRRLRGLTFDEPFYSVVEETYKTTTRHVALAWRDLKHKPHLVYVSACSVYPNAPGLVIDETTYPLPRHRLAAILRQAELNITEWTHGATALRFGWLLKPEHHWGRTFAAFQKFPWGYMLPGTGQGRANMVHVDDAARAIVHAIDARLGGIFNVCNDAHPAWGELWAEAGRLTGTEPPAWDPQMRDDWFEGDHIVSSDKLKATGFVFEHPLETGLSFLAPGVVGV